MKEESQVSTTSSSPANKKYWCFLSYRHTNNVERDREWASWLQQEIEQYDIPPELVGQKNARGEVIPGRIYPVFRDEESLPADANLQTQIEGALDQSYFLVVLCSPGAVESKYVSQEIAHFKRSRGGEYIIAAIIDGEPGCPETNCFPAALMHPIDENGEIITTEIVEPIAADFRLPDGSEGYTKWQTYYQELKNGGMPRAEAHLLATEYGNRLELMKLKVISGILGIELEQLRDRDRIYQLERARQKTKRQQRLTLYFAIAAVVSIAASFFAVKKEAEATRNLKKSNLEIARAWRERAIRYRDQGDFFGAALMAGKGLGFKGFGRPKTEGEFSIQHRVLLDEEDPDHQATKSSLTGMVRSAVRQLPTWRSEGHSKPVSSVAWNPAGKILASGSEDGSIILWGENGEMVNLLAGPAVRQIVSSLVWNPKGDLLASVSVDGSILLYSDNGAFVANLAGHSRPANAVSWSEDGEVLVTGDTSGLVRLWGSDGKLKKTIRHAAAVTAFSISSGDVIASGAKDGDIQFSDLDGTLRQKINVGDPVGFLGWSPDGKILAAGCSNGSVLLFNSSAEQLAKFAAHDSEITALSWNADGSLFGTGSKQGEMKVWDASGKLKFEKPGSENPIKAISWSSSRELFASQEETGPVTMWSATGELKAVLVSEASEWPSLAWNPSGQMIAGGCSAGAVNLWGETGECVRKMEGHTSPVVVVDWHPDGKILASGSWKGIVRFWSESGSLLSSVKAHASVVEPLVWQPRGRYLASGARDGAVQLWTAKGKPVQRISPNSGVIAKLAWRPDGEVLAIGTEDGPVKLWNVAGGALDSLEIHTAAAVSLTWSPGGKFLASGSEDGSIALWSAAGKLLKKLDAHSGRVTSLAWNPDGSNFASGSDKGEVKLWSPDGDLIHKLQGHTGTIVELKWSPDGTTLASCGWDSLVHLWSATGEKKALLQLHTDPVVTLDWSSDSKTLASGSWDQTVKLWNSAGELLISLRGHTDMVGTLAWNPVENQLATGCGDRKVRLFNFKRSDSEFDLARFLSNQWVQVEDGEYRWNSPGKSPVFGRGWIAAINEGNAANQTPEFSDFSMTLEETPVASERKTPWIFPDSDRRLLSDEEVLKLSPDEMWFARNELFARYGRLFSTPKGRSFINSLPLTHYRGATLNHDYVQKELNRVETANLTLILRHQ